VSVEVSYRLSQSSDVCSICLSGDEKDETPANMRMTCCNTSFHVHCLDTWLVSGQGGSNCPQCRTHIHFPQRATPDLSITQEVQQQQRVDLERRLLTLMQDQSDISLANVFGLEGLDLRSLLHDDDGAASDDDDDDDGSDGDGSDDDSDDDMPPGLVCTVMFSTAIHVSFMLK
jgi:hypothetical protein